MAKEKSGYYGQRRKFWSWGYEGEDISQEEIRGIGAENLAGHLAAWNYFQTTNTPQNKTFVEKYKARYGKDRVTDDPI